MDFTSGTGPRYPMARLNIQTPDDGEFSVPHTFFSLFFGLGLILMQNGNPPPYFIESATRSDFLRPTFCIGMMTVMSCSTSYSQFHTWVSLSGQIQLNAFPTFQLLFYLSHFHPFLLFFLCICIYFYHCSIFPDELN